MYNIRYRLSITVPDVHHSSYAPSPTALSCNNKKREKNRENEKKSNLIFTVTYIALNQDCIQFLRCLKGFVSEKSVRVACRLLTPIDTYSKLIWVSNGPPFL